MTMNKLTNVILQLKKMETLLVFIKRDNKIIQQTPQAVLLKGYGMEGRRMTISYAISIHIFWALYALLPLTPTILGSIHPTNKTRERQFLFPSKYFIDEEKYYCQIMIHQYVTSFAVALTVATADIMFITYVQHACAVFAVVSNQTRYLHVLKQVYVKNDTDNSLEISSNKEYTEQEGQEMYRKLKFVIKIHKNALEYCELLESTYTTSLAVQVLHSVVAISFTGIQLIINIDTSEDVMRFASFVIAHMFHLFFLCLPGQRLLDHTELMHQSMCAGKWYVYPPKAKVLYKMMLMKSLTPCKLTAAKMITMSMETFLSVVQTAVSYFTVLSSVR